MLCENEIVDPQAFIASASEKHINSNPLIYRVGICEKYRNSYRLEYLANVSDN